MSWWFWNSTEKIRRFFAKVEPMKLSAVPYLTIFCLCGSDDNFDSCREHSELSDCTRGAINNYQLNFIFRGMGRFKGSLWSADIDACLSLFCLHVLSYTELYIKKDEQSTVFLNDARFFVLGFYKRNKINLVAKHLLIKPKTIRSAYWISYPFSEYWWQIFKYRRFEYIETIRTMSLKVELFVFIVSNILAAFAGM